MERISETVRFFPAAHDYHYCHLCDDYQEILDDEEFAHSDDWVILSQSVGVYFCVQCDEGHWGDTDVDEWMETHAHVRMKTVQ